MLLRLQYFVPNLNKQMMAVLLANCKGIQLILLMLKLRLYLLVHQAVEFIMDVL
jgi:hypothetical protein